VALLHLALCVRTAALNTSVHVGVILALMASSTVTSVRRLKINFGKGCDMDDAFLNSTTNGRF